MTLRKERKRVRMKRKGRREEGELGKRQRSDKREECLKKAENRR